MKYGHFSHHKEFEGVGTYIVYLCILHLHVKYIGARLGDHKINNYATMCANVLDHFLARKMRMDIIVPQPLKVVSILVKLKVDRDWKQNRLNFF